MLVPFGAIPDHLLKPLHVDTTLQYNVKKLKLPNSKDPSYLESTLILAATLDLPHTASNSSDCCCCNSTPLQLPASSKTHYTGFGTNAAGFNLETGAFQDHSQISVIPQRNFTESDWPKTFSVLPLTIAPAHCMPTDRKENKQSENSFEFQVGFKPIGDSVNQPDNVLQNLKDIYLGQPLQFECSTNSTNVGKQWEDPHVVPETNIPLFPMKEEDIDWLFVNPITSEQESINDDVIRYTNLSNMGHIWQTDYSFNNTVRDNDWENQSWV